MMSGPTYKFYGMQASAIPYAVFHGKQGPRRYPNFKSFLKRNSEKLSVGR
jgi:hypothetical protein